MSSPLRSMLMPQTPLVLKCTHTAFPLACTQKIPATTSGNISWFFPTLLSCAFPPALLSACKAHGPSSRKPSLPACLLPPLPWHLRSTGRGAGHMLDQSDRDFYGWDHTSLTQAPGLRCVLCPMHTVSVASHRLSEPVGKVQC